MNLRESVGIALGGIRANKLRSFLTLLGTIIGVASVIAVVSFVEGMNRFVTHEAAQRRRERVRGRQVRLHHQPGGVRDRRTGART